MPSSSRLPAQNLDRLGDILQIFLRGAFRTPRAQIRFLMIAAEFLTEANHAQVIFNHGLASGGIFKVSTATSRTTSNAREPNANFIDPFL